MSDPSIPGSPSVAEDSAAAFPMQELLLALDAMRAGDFSRRLPDCFQGLHGQVCEAFNALAADNERKARQLSPELAADRVPGGTSELRFLDEKLERRVEEKTREREVAIAQLFEAQKMETIGRLTGGVAHDFNNLLMVILASLSLLEKHIPDDARSRKLLESARMGARRGSALTQRLLAFARRQDLRPEPLHLPDLLEGMSALFERALGVGIDLVIDVAPSLAKVLADANQLELALLNVALNARDAMPDGGQMTIEAHEVIASEDERLKPGEYVMISLTDNGSGMDEGTLSRATEPFFTTKAAGKGTGLGLSMIQGLAAQSGGLLRLRSARGTGTTVELILPKATAAMDSTEQPLAAELPAKASSSAVLLVDDDPLVLAGTSGLIEDLGYRAFAVKSGDEALALLAGGLVVEAVITDYRMPGMSGMGLASAIHTQYPDLPVIVMSGYMEVEQEPTQDWPWLGRLRKPCTQQDIGLALKAVTEARGAAALST